MQLQRRMGARGSLQYHVAVMSIAIPFRISDIFSHIFCLSYGHYYGIINQCM